MSDAGAFLGTNYTLQNTPVVATLPKAAVGGGIIYCSSDVVAAAGTDLGAGSTLHVAKLPKGAVVIFSIVTPVATATGIATAMTNAVTAVMGWTGDTNALGVITDLNASAAPQYIRPVPDGTTIANMTPLPQDRDIFITTAAAELVAAEGIDVRIFYTVAG